MSQVISIMLQSRPDLFTGTRSNFATDLNSRTHVENKRRKKTQIGLQVGEKNILHLLEHDCDVVLNDDTEVEVDLENNQLPDLHTKDQNVEHFLLSEDCPLLQNILNHLQHFNRNKWEHTTRDFLLTHILSDAQELMKVCILKEIAIIATEMCCFTGRCLYSSTCVKSENCNNICAAFGGTNFVDSTIGRRKERSYQPDSLLNISTGVVKIDSFPVEHIQIPLCTILQRENNRKWLQNFTVPIYAPIPSEANPRIVTVHEHFSYPEYSFARVQLEPRTFDFTHILTNMRCQILTRGFDYCQKKHFEELCTERPDILSIALVFDKIDTQNAFTAIKMFNYKVQRWMLQKRVHRNS